MINNILTVFIAFNAIAGFYFVVQAFWPAADPSAAKSMVVVMFFIIWGAAFLGLAWAVWARETFARLWTFILYGLTLFAVLFSLIGEFSNSHSYIFKAPAIYGMVYFVFLAIAVLPIVFMLRRDVKERFEAAAQERAQQEAEYRHADQNMKMRDKQ